MDITVSFTAVKSLTADEAKKWMNDRKSSEFTLLDVRQATEYQAGHIPGAMLIPLPELPMRMRELRSSLPVIVYCRSGNRSRSAASLLAEAGRAVFNLEGGMLAWNGSVAAGTAEQGLELIKGMVTPVQMASLAWALEEGAASFYRTVQENAREDPLRRTVETLVAAEEAHKQKVLDAFRSIGESDPGDGGQGEPLPAVMEGGFEVNGVIDHLRSRGFGMQETLETAMQIEANSLDLYMKIIRWSGIPEVKMIFSSLVEEERQHLVRLGALLESAAV